MHRLACRLLLVAGAALLAACSPPEPLRLGYIGTLSGRSADFGLSGRNGALLAVEQINAAGGINGRQITLLVRDDQQEVEAATRAIETLAKEKVVAVVGPMTSGMAYDLAPVAGRTGVLLVSPTATADELLGRDDNLIRLSSPTSDHARLDATFQFQHEGRRRIALILETGNSVYTEGYAKSFSETFVSLGGQIVGIDRFAAATTTDIGPVVQSAVAKQPDALFFVANAVDTARLAQHARQRKPALPLSACAWAGTEELTQLGGRAVEGMYVGQYFQRDHTAPAYIAFRKAYEARFQEPPGFGSTAAFDAVQVIATALRRKAASESLKTALLQYGPYAGLQQQIAFDRFGDTRRPSSIAVVRNNTLTAVHWP